MDMATAQQRTMKDFLDLYNRITHHCFERCISNFNHGRASDEENHCVDACTNKFINFNQRHMMTFMQHQNLKQKMAAKAYEEAQAQAVTAAATTAQQALPGQETAPQTLSDPGSASGASLEQAAGAGVAVEAPVLSQTSPQFGGSPETMTAASHTSGNMSLASASADAKTVSV